MTMVATRINPLNAPTAATGSSAARGGALLQRKVDPRQVRSPVVAAAPPTAVRSRFDYDFAGIQIHPQSCRSDLQQQPAAPETKPAEPQPASGTGQTPAPADTGHTPATPAAGSGKCPGLPAPGFEAILSPRDKLATRKPNGVADFHAGVGNFNVGIGEVVDVSYRSVAGEHPSQNPEPEFFGGLRWTATGGVLTEPKKPDDKWTWTAPDIESSVHIKAITQAQNCTLADITVHIFEPDTVKMEKQGGTLKDQTGKVTAGMFVHILILPDDVSFSAVKVQEGDAMIQGHGWWKFLTGKHHCKGSGAGKYDGDNSCSANNLIVIPSKGTMVNGSDKISSGTSNWNKSWQTLDPKEKKRLEDNDLGTYEDPSDGYYTWDIPWLYVLGQGAPTPFKTKTVRVEVKTDPTGKCTIQKDDSGYHSTEFNDPATPFVAPPGPKP